MVNKRKRSKKWISWLIILILLIGAVVVCYLVWESYFKEIERPETSEEVEVRAETEEETPTEEVLEKKEEVIQYDGGNPNEAERLSGAITYAGVTGDKLIIRVNIDQFLSGGSCKLRLVLEGDIEVYGDEVGIIDSASTATCAGFDVPVGGFKSGKYDIYINLSSGGKVGTINGEVSL